MDILKCIYFSETQCDAVHLENKTRSSRYRLHRTKFSFMVDAKENVSVLLTSESRATSSRYEIVIGYLRNTMTKLMRINDGMNGRDLMTVNMTDALKENEMRSFWVEVEKERVLFGSGEKVMNSTDMVLKILRITESGYCSTFVRGSHRTLLYSQLKCVFRLDKNVSHSMSHNSLTA